MNQHKYLSDNSGNRVPPCACLGDPVAASGQKIVVVGTETITVEAGAVYRIYVFTDPTFLDPCLFSTTGVTSTAANIEWVCPAGKTILVKVPVGKTTLYVSVVGTISIVFISKLK